MCMFCRSFFVLFLLAIMLSVLLQIRDSGYHFGMFKLLFSYTRYTGPMYINSCVLYKAQPDTRMSIQYNPVCLYNTTRYVYIIQPGIHCGSSGGIYIVWLSLSCDDLNIYFLGNVS
jgi:hypothetical protein